MTNECKQLRHTVEWGQPDTLAPSLRTHVANCDDCRRYLNDWPTVEQELRELLAAPELEDALARQQTAAVLVARAKASTKRGTGWTSPRPVWIWGTALASILLLVIGVRWFFITDAPPAAPQVLPVSVRYLNGTSSEKVLGAGQTVVTPKNARSLMTIGDDTIGVRAQSQVRIHRATSDRVVLGLQNGAVACDVAHRTAPSHFIVESGSVRVTVVGTRFSVESQTGAVVVAVNNGTVKVEQNGKQWLVNRGNRLRVPRHGMVSRDLLSHSDTLLIDALLSETTDQPVAEQPADVTSPPATGETPDNATTETAASEVNALIVTDTEPGNGSRRLSDALSKPSQASSTGLSADKWRQWIVSGKLTAAESEISAYLRHAPRDRMAWTLLADCHRKAQKWDAAVADYRKVIQLSPPKERRRAQYRAASILQDELADHRGAISLLEKYLSSATNGDALGAEAQIRLARSYLKVGNSRQARALLQSVISRYPGTPSATRARRILDSI